MTHKTNDILASLRKVLALLDEASLHLAAVNVVRAIEAIELGMNNLTEVGDDLSHNLK
jgi:hypothetical protein